MDEKLKQILIEAAERHENKSFIADDPIQFPHRYTERNDIEISSFISAWMAYGSRKVFLNVLRNIHSAMDTSGGPSDYIKSQAWLDISSESQGKPDCCLYRFYKWKDYSELCVRLHRLYSEYATMESILDTGYSPQVNVRKLCSYFTGIKGIPIPDSMSANKRIHMFLRWMVRKGSPVDFGLWNRMKPAQLVIPLDTHVFQTASCLGLTSRNSADIKTALQITDSIRVIWPEDPVKGDFALYGLGLDGFTPYSK
ncbi:MAG: TIGR02757 family protein [Bacteroidaceae bacterium]|nr:TIGR02757 family protein [Bacteroidaceae bacterium]